MKKYIKMPILIGYAVIVGIMKSVSVDLFLNIKQAIKYTLHPDERLKMSRELEAEKRVDIVEERMGRVERLLYSVFEDPEYTKSDKGKYDLKKLQKEVK